MKHINKFKEFLSENLKYHLENEISILENVFRPYSDSFYDLIKEARFNYENGKIDISLNDSKLFDETDFGLFEYYNNELVPLDLPIEVINEAEYKGREVELNKPTRSSGPKKYKVYVKDPKTGNVKCINFGDVKGGLTAKVSDPKARKSFAKRHKCHLKKDKTTPGYWSCRLPKFKHLVNTTYNGYW